MRLEGKRIGVAVTGSFCTYQKIFLQIQKLVEAGAEVQTIFSAAAAGMDSRFGKAEDFLKRAEEITGKKPFQTILESERIGPTAMFDVLVIMPCTGNTLAKLANGITDGAVLMGQEHLFLIYEIMRQIYQGLIVLQIR